MLKREVWAILPIFMACLCAQAQSKGIALTGVNVISPLHKKTLYDQTVYIEGDLIKHIGKTSQVALPNTATILDAKGKYLIPGISEMHAHIPVPDSSGDATILNQTLFLYLANGITTIRGMLGQAFHLNIREALSQKHIDLYPPNMYTSSPSFNGNTMPDIATAEAAVKRYKSDGYHFLKIHPGIKREVYDAIVKTAHAEKIDFAGHVPVEVGIVHALQSGQKTIDHLDGYIEALAPPLKDLNQNGFFGFNVTDQINPDRIKALVKLTKKSKAWLVPTQSLFTRWFSPEDPNAMMQTTEMSYMPARTRYAWLQSKSNLLKSEGYTHERYSKYLDARKKLLFSLYKGKAGLLLGSDAPQVMNVPGYSIHHEMESWAEAGIPAWSILQAGTINVARFFNTQDVDGEIAPGYHADLILLDKNPIEDIHHAHTIQGIMHRGQWLSKEMIQERLKEIAAQNE
jgi:imidazolonepropionase-like amidohydrolase